MAKPSKELRGTVEAFNISPKGRVEGLLLRGRERLQINLAKELGSKVVELFRVGDSIHVEAEMEAPHGHPEHPVYRLLKVDRRGHAEGGTPTEPGEYRFEGIVERLNYALHGEINGAILDSGDFLHLKPSGAAAAKLKTGMVVQGYGMRKPLTGEYRVIEAKEVNGISIEAKVKPKKKT